MSESPKDDLILHIEAYAASKQVSNQLLQEWAARMMSSCLDGLTVSLPAQGGEVVLDASFAHPLLEEASAEDAAPEGGHGADD